MQRVRTNTEYQSMPHCRSWGMARLMVLLMLMGIAAPLLAQRRVSPADTGRMTWGHADFRGYDRAAMCNRTIDEVARQHTRIYIQDTSYKSVRRDRSISPKIPAAVVETLKRCIAHLRLDEQTPDQLWAVARIYMVIGEGEKSKAVTERVIATGINRDEQLEMMIQAIEMYINYSEEYVPYAYHFANVVRSMQPVSHVSVFKVDNLLSNYYVVLYEPDSILTYSSAAIDRLKSMSIAEMDSVPAFDPFNAQINIANVNGDIPLQEKLVERASTLVSGWRQGAGDRMISAHLSGVDIKKTIYNKRTKALTSSMWENYDGVPRPLIGKPSLFVTVSHNCAPFCFRKLSVIKRLMQTFGDSIDLVLITPTMGYGPGSGPLSPADEAKWAARFFKDFQKLPYTLLVDESPSRKLPDGRIVRELSPVVQMLNDINGANAIVTDADGRIQWAGQLLSEWYLRTVTAVIDRALSRTKKH